MVIIVIKADYSNTILLHIEIVFNIFMPRK
jgi:hypothetical protein